MLKLRMLTAFILGPLFLAGIIWLPDHLLAMLIAIIILLAAKEWSDLIDIRTTTMRIIYLLCFALALYASYYYQEAIIGSVLIISILWWCFASILILRYPVLIIDIKSLRVASVLSFITLIPSWLAIIVMNNGSKGFIWLLFFFFLIWFVDSAAYFAGTWWGKTKLAPKVSPGKSWAGFFAGLFIAILMAVIFAYNMGFSDKKLLAWLVLVVITMIFSVIGDLWESIIKRVYNKKDSSDILPGHGGILDRIDSITAAAPVFAFGLLHLNLI